SPARARVCRVTDLLPTYLGARLRGAPSDVSQHIQQGEIPLRKLFCLLVATGSASLWSAGAVAQTKVTGTHACSKPDPQHTLPAGDRPDHSFVVEQLKC